MLGCARAADAPAPAPLRVLLAGLAHGHAGGFLGQPEPAVVTPVGVWEPDATFWAKYRTHVQLAQLTSYTDLPNPLAQSGPDAVWPFCDTRDHLPIVRAAAPRHLPVIVEKTLALFWPAAAAMAAPARRHGTLKRTNSETSW